MKIIKKSIYNCVYYFPNATGDIIESLNTIPEDIDIVYIVYSPQGCRSYLRESFIYVDNELLNDNEPTDVEKVEIVGKNRTEFSILIKYSPWEMYLLETEETEERGKKYKNIYYFLKNYVKFPPKCEIVLVRNGIEERFANVESMPDDDPMRHIKNYLTLFPI